MSHPEFARRFKDHHEIGREVTATHLLVFYDDGQDIGLWREDRRSTVGTGTLLARDDADMARYWYRNGVHKWVEAASSARSPGPQR